MIARLATLLLALAACAAPDPGPLRIGVLAERRDREALSPLVYGGGFHTKTLVWETLVTNDARGRLAPGLAESWERRDGGRTWELKLRPDARFHDGSPCDAAAVAAHVARWVGDPEHAWVGAAGRIAAVEALDPRRLRFRLAEPYPLPADLALINPTAVIGPDGAGTGPYRLVGHEPDAVARYARADAEGPGPAAVELVLLDGDGTFTRAHVARLLAGEIDALVDDWAPRVPRERLAELGARDELRVHAEPGSAVVLLAFQTRRPPFDEPAWRRRVAGAIDRAALVAGAEAGFARPTRSLFAPRLEEWPATDMGLAGDRPEPAWRARPVRLLAARGSPGEVRAARLIARQLLDVGLDVRVEAAGPAALGARRAAGEYELLVTRTWGLPYDPHATLLARFMPAAGETAVEDPPLFTHPDLSAAIVAAWRADDRRAAWTRVADVLAEHLPVVPLYVPDHVALLRSRADGLRFGSSGYTLDLRRAR